MYDVAIKSSRIIVEDKLKAACILIKDGSIVDVVSDFSPAEDHLMIDVGNKMVMPGLFDPHVHINEPGRTGWEGFETATRAAIAGGVTTLVDMPLNSSPVTTSVKAFEKKLAAAQGQLHANCGFWGGLVPGNVNEIEGLVEMGVLGFKAFLTHSGIDEFPNVAEDDLRKAMPVIAKYRLPLLVHCELPTAAKQITNRQSYRQYMESRPKEWEDNAITLMIRLCEEYNCHTHIVHLSSSGSIEQIRKARERGLPLTVETAQHYLFFKAEEIQDKQTQFKCAPPIREMENNERLWEALQEGVIDFVATDHSPAPPDLKQMETGDFINAWGGIASLQFALPALWTVAKTRGAPYCHISRWLSGNPAMLAGKQHTKGKIAKGYDADLIVWNPDAKFVVTEDTIQHKHKMTPYLGRELFGVVQQTFLGGTKVYEKDGFISLYQGKILLR